MIIRILNLRKDKRKENQTAQNMSARIPLRIKFRIWENVNIGDEIKD